MVGVGAAALACAPAAATQVETELRLDASGSWFIEVSPDVALVGDWVGPAGDMQRMDSTSILYVPGQGADGFVVAAADGSNWERVGRSGRGPGEYRYIRWVVARDGHLHVFDAAGMRRTVLDGGLDVIHTNPLYLNLAGSAVVLPDLTYIVNGSIPTPDRVGYVLHHFGSDGKVVRSFDESPDGYGTPDAGITRYRSLVLAENNTLWSAHRTRYQVDSWDLDRDVRDMSLVRRADWFPPHKEWGSNDPAQPPKPHLLDLEEDSEGRLWVLIGVASEHWAEGFVRTPEDAHPELGRHMIDDRNTSYDTIVEVIDPTARCILATITVDHRMSFFVGPGWAASYLEDHQGSPTQQLWRLELRGPSPTPKRETDANEAHPSSFGKRRGDSGLDAGHGHRPESTTRGCAVAPRHPPWRAAERNRWLSPNVG